MLRLPLALLLVAVVSGPAFAQRPVAARPAATSVAPLDSSLVASMRFRSVGPTRGGRSTAIAGIPSQPHTFLSGSTGGGVWRTDDAGQSWRNISDGYFGGVIGAVRVADSDPNVIYVGTGSQDVRGNSSTGRGAWKSTDGGKRWTFIGLGETGAIGRIAVHPTNPDVVYMSALGHPFGRNRERGIYRSRDGGTSWQQVLFLNDSTGASDLVMDPKNPRILYAAFWRGERKPWTMISGSSEGGIWKSTDAGDTWTKLGGGLPTGLTGKIGLTVSPANPERVWAIIEAEPLGGLYRSDDAGATWARVNDENRIRQRAWYYYRLVADPVDEHTVWIMSVQLHRSIDGGKTLEAVAVPHGDTHDLWINPAQPKIMALSDDGGSVVSLNGGRSWSSMNVMPTAELYEVVVDHAFPYRLYGSQQDNTSISVPSASGPNDLHPLAGWRYASGCETGPVSLHPDHPGVIWGGCYGGAINRWDLATGERRNVNLYPQQLVGQAAKDVRYRFQWVAPILVSRHDPEVVYHASQFVHRTRDGGMRWETISPDLTTNDPVTQQPAGGPINYDGTGVEMYNTVFALAEDPKDAAILWAGSDDGRLHLTRDGGRRWQNVTPTGMPARATVNRIDVSVHVPGRAYVTAHRYRLDDWAPYVWRTDDYGATWTRIADGTNGIPATTPVRVVREDRVRAGLLYAGTEFGLYVSLDNGARWQPFQRNLPIVPVTDVALTNDDVVLSTQGRSFWILDDITPLRQLAAARPDGAVHLFAPRTATRAELGGVGGAGGVEAPLDPYPAGALLHYWLRDAVAGPLTLEVRDGAGRVVRAFTSDTAAARVRQLPALSTAAGAHRVTWDLTYAPPVPAKGQLLWGYSGGVKAPPGRYTVRLTQGAIVQEQPLTVRGDPRLRTTAEAYDLQFRTAMAVRDTMTVVNEAVATLRAVREQARAALAQADRAGAREAVQPGTDALVAKGDAIEGRLTDPRHKVGYDILRFGGRLDNQLNELYGNLTGTGGYINGGADAAPTMGALERTTALTQEWNAIAAELRTFLDKDVSAFNAAIAKLGLAPVVVPRAVVK
ncbi:MAG: glycosyl hydrolase [Gemmatimonadota bacterium]|nr:glycosyl hydrolase [Gemmatimonadota bacterium]MDQ8168320.1 glycosyl hydrolase [Gemmatimonadota bacterium]MDQ8171931.1 glycosyl hydrolase [Gemmatimonadota bacterium]